ncbi:MAG: UvrABC system protein B [Candidatus Amesbacteria bacterium GW2011_GWB1_47_19]|nr:MAG: UvrABC system protein B [Candidatus Amesbacteria bacterium GW2011_GWA1_44_24]KKU31157.1 MAG: UvrABC system protein B [Candidatus Amesbacteria bacterium GW2011_GWC1_46_24]KKU67278.1 MAG: UvrABC system protein B [Candidatus Amesbacteria bacterium GW2011_GWB1_47_19]OGD05836.1 MAG: excinuclease ABC subunit B [Candidatus Amesbacteria bacterium RIFOXYB1_FULL_47_13]HBC72699.1 excinuclease ABC subunit B [Candidatus Amesbacteria bacterium]
MFKLVSPYHATGDQPQAIEKLIAGLKSGQSHQVLLGVTGSGKTFTMANVIAAYQKPTLIISHNKTLAAQLYQEFKEYFPDNAVSYFVSYYDYYQPEAYIPSTDTYIEKETDINAEIDKLRLAATTNLLTRKDTLVVASVSCIYNLGSPAEYGKSVLELVPGLKVTREQITLRLNHLQYSRSDFDFRRGTYRLRGEVIDIYPAYEDTAVRIRHDGIKITKIEKINSFTGEIINPESPIINHVIYPAKHYIASRDNQNEIFSQITSDLTSQEKLLRGSGKILEAHRLHQRVTYDLEMIRELGYVNGIENYSRYFDGRNPGDPPYSLLDYFPKDYLLIIDESHITVPQVRGMYNGDRSRKQTLIDFGFRLPSALDNRPLKFDEFQRRMGLTMYTSATPNDWEISLSSGQIVEQLIRPTGLVDPQILVLPTKNQISSLVSHISDRTSRGQRVLVTTLTKRMAEDLSAYLQEHGIKVHYLHADIETLTRLDVLSDLRSGTYDVVVGINLLREGLDLPEVSLVAILDADKEGFLRSRTSLIQTMGRAARHVDGQVIMYADHITDSMRHAISEVERRREIQLEYNLKHHIIPASITKPIRERIVEAATEDSPVKLDPAQILKGRSLDASDVDMSRVFQLTPSDLTKLVKIMNRDMIRAAKNLDFELAAKIRDRIAEIRGLKDK